MLSCLALPRAERVRNVPGLIEDGNNFIRLDSWGDVVHVTLILDYSKERIVGGPEGVAFDTVEGLKKSHGRLLDEDIHIHVMSSSGSRSRSLFEIDEEYQNISFEYFKRMVPTALLSDLDYYLRVKNREEPIDLVHSHAISGAAVGCLLRLPTVLTLHGMVWKEKQFVSNPYSRLAMEINAARFQYASSRLAKLIAISPYVIGEVDEFLRSETVPREVIENPVSDLFFSVEKQEVEGLLIYPAGINSRKNQMGLIRALDLLKREKIEFHCVLPGPTGDDEHLSHLLGAIRKFGLEKDVTLPGTIPFTDLLRLYSEASVMVMTSLQETAPMVISEAMATGTPVIASRISGVPYMVAHGESGFLIDPQSPDDIATSTALLLDDSTLRRRMGEESKRIAASRWRNDLIIGKQLDAYQDAVATQPSAS